MNFSKRFKDIGIEGVQAKAYDELTREHRIAETKEQAREVENYIKEGDNILEIAPGAGYLSIELGKTAKYNITGMDISKDLIEICTKNAKEAEVDINFIQGNASTMPFHSNEFNFIICVLAFKNFKEPGKVLQEMHRVLKLGGMALIIDMNKEASMKFTKKVAENMGLRGFQAYMAGIIQRSLAYTRKEYEILIAGSPFSSSEIKDSNIGFNIYLKK